MPGQSIQTSINTYFEFNARAAYKIHTPPKSTCYHTLPVNLEVVMLRFPEKETKSGSFASITKYTFLSSGQNCASGILLFPEKEAKSGSSASQKISFYPIILGAVRRCLQLCNNR
jgi:hypothetical protein